MRMQIGIILNLDNDILMGEAGRTMKDVKSRTVFVPPQRETDEVKNRLAAAGLRPTAQRGVVYGVLLGERDHPTADEVFLRAKRVKPDISMATVYNCLDAMLKCDLVKQVRTDEAATRYCPNMNEHAHFHCEECGQIFDIEGSAKPCEAGLRMPRGFKVRQFEMSLSGLCKECAKEK